ncbi:hypothetical protein E2C01_063641 [Portunus trituberculatus]|uniref:Uncharacterized protein n=1 Tax=Portunus trituberculatus TaxID=210409 RepID=A0A5B7HJJ9_PORTR|nr:hypothetical protein [Portunus trituberculatus]
MRLKYQGREDEENADSGHFFSPPYVRVGSVQSGFARCTREIEAPRSHPLKSHFGPTLCSLQRLSREIRVGETGLGAYGGGMVMVVVEAVSQTIPRCLDCVIKTQQWV